MKKLVFSTTTEIEAAGLGEPIEVYISFWYDDAQEYPVEYDLIVDDGKFTVYTESGECHYELDTDDSSPCYKPGFDEFKAIFSSAKKMGHFRSLVPDDHKTDWSICMTALHNYDERSSQR